MPFLGDGKEKFCARGPPLRESKKIKKGPINGKLAFEVTEKINSAQLPPTPPNGVGYLSARKISATTPPPTETDRVL